MLKRMENSFQILMMIYVKNEYFQTDQRVCMCASECMFHWLSSKKYMPLEVYMHTNKMMLCLSKYERDAGEKFPIFVWLKATNWVCVRERESEIERAR